MTNMVSVSRTVGAFGLLGSAGFLIGAIQPGGGELFVVPAWLAVSAAVAVLLCGIMAICGYGRWLGVSLGGGVLAMGVVFLVTTSAVTRFGLACIVIGMLATATTATIE
ncbi:MAG: hypothetical protein J07HQX50_02885 [Haloquadratum sp. J07HQX50]|jgi:hypothetical protein|nr:MAG: hypothetical protein J07HQX50_02885 [Haloquadratum sp. J07HQX50]